MAITDINISEELITNAPSIKYRGEEGPRSPEEMEMMRADAMLREAYDQYVYDLLEQKPYATPMSFEEFRRMVIAEGQMSGGQPLPQDPTEPVNPFKPKPIGPVLPDKNMMAGSDRYQRILEQLINELEDQLGRELTDAEYDMVGRMAYEKLSDPDYAVGGRVDYALGTKPTAE